MADLSFTHKYTLCALYPDGSVGFIRKIEVFSCIVAAGIWELMSDGYVALNEKKQLAVQKELAADKSYLQPLYRMMKQSKPMKATTIAEKYVLSFTSKRMNELIREITSSMVDNHAVREHSKQGLFSDKTVFAPEQAAVDAVVQKIRAEFLEDGSISDETVVLGALLKESGLLKKYFSNYESEKVSQRIKEIKDTQASAFVKEILDDIATWIVIIVSAGSTR